MRSGAVGELAAEALVVQRQQRDQRGAGAGDGARAELQALIREAAAGAQAALGDVVDGADLLADVAAEDVVADQRTQLQRDGAAVLDGEVRDAAAAIEHIRGDEGAGGAGVEAARRRSRSMGRTRRSSDLLPRVHGTPSDRTIGDEVFRWGGDASFASLRLQAQERMARNDAQRHGYTAQRASAQTEKERRANRARRLNTFIARAAEQAGTLDDLDAEQRRHIVLDLHPQVKVGHKDRRDGWDRVAVLFELSGNDAAHAAPGALWSFRLWEDAEGQHYTVYAAPTWDAPPAAGASFHFAGGEEDADVVASEHQNGHVLAQLPKTMT
jgi:hypothetical protein